MMRRTRLALKLRCDMGDNWHGYHHRNRQRILIPNCQALSSQAPSRLAWWAFWRKPPAKAHCAVY